MSEPTQQTTIAAMRPKELSNQKVDMFSTQGFALANRIATAFASSNAIPAQYRAYNLKMVNGQEQWAGNPSALGNCIVAIEIAQAIGMSISSVMQNSDVIDGKVRWSDKFVVAGVNASRRFTPLRFDVKSFGIIKVGYKEKTGWNNSTRRFDMIDKTAEIENIQCVAWALPFGTSAPASIHTLKQAKDAGLPVVEGPPISIKLAVEEGWYGKSGSKWQTELKHKMLMMRAGRYFGDVHAADITMGIGKTTEEEFDVIDMNQDGSVSSITTETLRNAHREALSIKTVQSEQLATSAAATTAQEKKDIQACLPTETIDAVIPLSEPKEAGLRWEPSPAEKAEIHAREMAEAGLEVSP